MCIRDSSLRLPYDHVDPPREVQQRRRADDGQAAGGRDGVVAEVGRGLLQRPRVVVHLGAEELSLIHI